MRWLSPHARLHVRVARRLAPDARWSYCVGLARRYLLTGRADFLAAWRVLVRRLAGAERELVLSRRLCAARMSIVRRMSRSA